MCGLAGVFLERDFPPQEIRNVVDMMIAKVAHRGPDGSGVYCRGRIALAHRRLSILDLSEAGAQPMVLRPGGAVISYNGEVYNFQELRVQLQSKGYTFRGHSDTEVVLATYDCWGLDGLRRLEGMFAIALWDPSTERLILMRDRLGIKPLFYAPSHLGLTFASEIKALLTVSGVDKRLDDQAFSEYLWYGNSHEDRTFFRGVRSLLPGHWLIADRDGTRLEAWWRVEDWLTPAEPMRNVTDGARRVRETLDQAVTRQLVADVPVGIFLSGGLDSSAIAASAARSNNRSLSSYSAAFDFDRGINELPKARSVAKHLGLDHHELLIRGEDLPAVMLAMADAHDEPFADAANIPLYLMCRLLNGVKVVLQGDGGDELFGGYRRYALLRNARWWNMWPKPMVGLARTLGTAGRRWARLADALRQDQSALRMGLLLTVETLHDPPEGFLSSDRRAHLAATTDPFLAYRHAATRFAACDPVQQMLLTDLTVQLPSQFLTKVDRSTMAASVEVRVPLLDELVARPAVWMPSDWKASGTQKKIVLRESQRSRLPSSILDGPKTGFGVPFEYWLRTSLFDFARERILDRSFLDRFGLVQNSVEKALVDHQSGRRERGFSLWKILQLSLARACQV